MRLKGVCIIGVLTLLGISAHSSAVTESTSSAIESNRTKHTWHLPNTTHPVHYHLHLTTDIHRQMGEYRGNNSIELEVLQDCTEIVLHAMRLTITDINIRNLETNELHTTCIRFELDETYQLLIIKCAPNCGEGCSFKRYQRLFVTILFEGSIGDGQMGFIKMKHDVKDPTTVFGAYTNLEPAHARTVFPCYDEPRLKANFTISITHGSNYSAHSAMPAVSEEPIQSTDLVTTHFATTPLISTYLVSVVVSTPFQAVEQSSSGVLHRVLVPATSSSNATRTHMFLNNSIAVVELIGDYWQQPYSLPKLDHCAVPDLLPAGMENWGLIIYKLKYLLDFKKQDKYEQQLSLITQTHEIVHQWFGNLVSISWWSHLWLSEAFATYYSYVFTEKLYPEYKSFYILDATCYNSFDLSENHSVVSHIDTPQELALYQRSMMYDRAPCILQMFNHAFGEDVLRRALSSYLALYKYKSVDTDSLTNVLQDAVKDEYSTKNQSWTFQVSEIVQSWLGQKDYPIVVVRRNYTSNTLLIAQESFDAESSSRWWLPLDIVAGAECATKLFMPAVTSQVVDLNIDLNCSAAASWYLVNPNGKGYFPVDYDTENWMRLAKALQHTPHYFKSDVRIAIIRNAWYATRMQLIEDPLILLELLKYLRRETDMIVLRELSGLLYDVHNEIFMLSAFDALYSEFILANLQGIVTDIIDDKEVGLMELKFYIYDIQKQSLFWNDADFEMHLNACLEPKALEICCWHCLHETRNESNFEKLLEAVYNYTGSRYCEMQLAYIAHATVSVHSVDRSITWTKLAGSFEHVLDAVPCELSNFANSLLSRAHRIQQRFLDKVLQAADVYDRKVVNKDGQTLRAAILHKRHENHLTRGAGLRRWFFERVSDVDLNNFFQEQRAIDTNLVEP